MKEQLISYKTAVLTKEIGFDEPCSHYYILDFQNFKADGVLNKTGLPDNYSSDNIYQFVRRKNQPHLASAPTQSLLQRWLREVHDIDIFITEGFHNISKYKVYTNPSWGYFEEYSTYEEALEKGLKQAMLIIKEKQNDKKHTLNVQPN